jgi:hypothetical protein
MISVPSLIRLPEDEQRTQERVIIQREPQAERLGKS